MSKIKWGDNCLEVCSLVRNRETFAPNQVFSISHAFSLVSILSSFYNNIDSPATIMETKCLVIIVNFVCMWKSFHLYDWGMTTKLTSEEVQRNYQWQLHKVIFLEWKYIQALHIACLIYIVSSSLFIFIIMFTMHVDYCPCLGPLHNFVSNC